MTDFPPPGEQPTTQQPPPPTSPPPPQPQPLPTSPPGPGWWQASDGNWYPPETAPGFHPPTAYGGAGYGYTPYAASRGTNGMAIASFVLGILWLEWIGSVLALVFGYIALSQIKQRQQGGRGFAIAGIVLGWVEVGLLLLVVLLALASSN